jgi:hypothetical protein
MVERRSRLRLAQEPIAEALVPRQVGDQELERDLAAEADVLRAVHGAHAAAPEQLLEPKAGDLASRPWVGPDWQTPS